MSNFLIVPTNSPAVRFLYGVKFSRHKACVRGDKESGRKKTKLTSDVALAPAGIQIANPAFDVTPNRYVAAIITEKGIARPPFRESLQALARR